MSGASEAVDALHETARANYRAVFEAGTVFARQHVAVAKAEDVVEVMQKITDLIVSVEQLHDMAERATKELRAKLAEMLQETGAMKIQADHHVAYVSRKPQFLAISDETIIPREYYTQPAPALDRRAVTSALKDGMEIPGVSLATPNEMTLTIRAKEAGK